MTIKLVAEGNGEKCEKIIFCRGRVFLFNSVRRAAYASLGVFIYFISI